MTMIAYDVDFARAVDGAANGQPDKLAAMLRNGCQLGEGERELLAQLILGERKATTGGRPKGRTKLTGNQQRNIATEYEDRRRNGEKADAIKSDLRERYSVGLTTISDAIRDFRPKKVRHFLT